MKQMRSLYPDGYNIVSKNKNHFLLNVYYDHDEDILFQVYKDTSTGKKFLHKTHNPQVPVMISKMPQKRPLEYILYDETTTVMIGYKNKTKELRRMLFGSKIARYKDHAGNLQEKEHFPKMPRRAEFLHPDLYMADLSIEEVILTEYTLSRYEIDPATGYSYERVPIPPIDYGFFDIETVQDDDGVWRIHTNTYVDMKTKTGYLDYWYRKDFHLIDDLETKKEEFIQLIKDTMENEIASSTLGDATREDVQKKCREFMKDMKFIIRKFDTEEQLILSSTRLMFTECNPDILVAFNTSYDICNFQWAIERLGLPKGTLNKQGIGFENITPPFAKWRTVDGYGTMRPNLTVEDGLLGDQMNPSTRRISMNVIGETTVACYQVAYYSSRRNENFASYSLDATALNVLGFGKFDFSKYSNSITRLAKANYWIHSLYAIMDSIVLGMCNTITDDFHSKLVYQYRTKVPIEQSPSSNITICRCIITDIYANTSYLSGNNINKILRYLNKEEVDQLKELIGIDYGPYVTAVRYMPSFGGGLVSDPNMFKPDDIIIDEYNILGREADLTSFLKIPYILSIDAKSHYPFQYITRNLSKMTLYGKITSVQITGTDILTRAISGRSTKTTEVTPHLGAINLAIANNDIISFSNLTCKTPSSSEIISKFIEYDADPILSVKSEYGNILQLNKKYESLFKVMRSINKKKLAAKDEDYMKKDPTFFLLNNGSFRYYGNRIDYNYNGTTIYDILDDENKPDMNIPLYAKTLKGEIIIDNNILDIPKNDRFNLNTEFKPLSYEELLSISMDDVFTNKRIVNGQKLLTINKNFYFPFAAYFKWYDNTKASKYDPQKTVQFSNILIRNEVLERTIKWEFTYNIQYKDVSVDIIQSFQSANLDYKAIKSANLDYKAITG